MTDYLLIAILVLILILVVALSFGAMRVSYADEVDDDGYVDLNAVEPDDTEPATENKTTTSTDNKSDNITSKLLEDAKNTNTANATNTTNKTNTTNTTKANNTANPTNTAEKSISQAGDFLDAKIIGAALIAVGAVVIAFAKIKKYSF